jgi:hypothetical protein
VDYNVAFDFFTQTLAETRRCVVPLYRMVGNPRRPEFIGSSVYCRFGPIQMIITAGHVLREILPERAWYPHSTEEFRELPCDSYALSKIEADDSAVGVLNESLPMWTPIPSERFGTFDPREEYQHILYGYPGSSTKGSTPHAQRIEIKGYLTSATPPGDYTRMEVDSKLEFAVLFKKENVFKRDLKKITFPNPNGMSGGPVFQFHESNARAQHLVGVMTRWDANRKKAIIATRIETITNKFHVVRVDPAPPVGA